MKARLKVATVLLAVYCLLVSSAIARQNAQQTPPKVTNTKQGNRQQPTLETAQGQPVRTQGTSGNRQGKSSHQPSEKTSAPDGTNPVIQASPLKNGEDQSNQPSQNAGAVTKPEAEAEGWL